MTDKKIRCALAYRIDPGKTTILAKYDHASQLESHGGAGGEPSLYGDKNKSFAEAVAKVIENDPPGGLSETGQIGGFKVVQSDQHQVVYGADADRICLAVVAGKAYPSRIAIQMLQELYKDFIQNYLADAKKAKKDVLTSKAKTMLKDICTKYDDLSKVDKTQAALAKVDVAKAQMQKNIAGMLKNQEAADTLAEKANDVNEQAMVFKKSSKKMKNIMAWKNLKTTLMFGSVIIIALVVILVPLFVKPA